MTRYRVNLVHFVDADDADAAIAAARDGREPIIGEAIPWGSDRVGCTTCSPMERCTRCAAEAKQ